MRPRWSRPRLTSGICPCAVRSASAVSLIVVLDFRGWSSQDLISSGDLLKPCDNFGLLAWIAIRMELKGYTRVIS